MPRFMAWGGAWCRSWCPGMACWMWSTGKAGNSGRVAFALYPVSSPDLGTVQRLVGPLQQPIHRLPLVNAGHTYADGGAQGLTIGSLQRQRRHGGPHTLGTGFGSLWRALR